MSENENPSVPSQRIGKADIGDPPRDPLKAGVFEIPNHHIPPVRYVNVSDERMPIEGFDEFVPQFFVMDPKTDKLLFDGGYLRDGMKVLIEDPRMRMPFDPSKRRDGEYIYMARMTSRWCTVTHLRDRGDFVTFIGVYDDQTEMKRPGIPKHHAWYVKKETIPDEMTPEAIKNQNRFEAVQMILTEGLLNPNSMNVTEMTKAIMGIMQ